MRWRWCNELRWDRRRNKRGALSFGGQGGSSELALASVHASCVSGVSQSFTPGQNGAFSLFFLFFFSAFDSTSLIE